MNTRTKTDPADLIPAVEPAVARTKRVILQRPAGNQDLGTMIGFNEFCQYLPFDVVIELPAEVVDYMRQQRVVNYYPGNDGQPTASYSAKFNLLDA